MNSLKAIEVIAKYNDFWDNHSLLRFPESLIDGIVTLKNTELISPAPKVLNKIKTMILSSNERILAAADHVPRLLFPYYGQMIRDMGIEAYSLTRDLSPDEKIRYGRELLLGRSPIEIREYLKKYNQGFKRTRRLPIENIYMGIFIVDDKEAGIFFPDNKGLLDWNYAIYGMDSDFISWAEKNFWYMHEKGKSMF